MAYYGILQLGPDGSTNSPLLSLWALLKLILKVHKMSLISETSVCSLYTCIVCEENIRTSLLIE